MKEYDLNGMKKIVSEQSKHTIIDVRKPKELAKGMIPSAHNIPVEKLKKALEMKEDKFQKKFRFRKPGKKDRLIFYCRTDVRGEKAAEIALGLGYEKVGHYLGSIWEWASVDSRVKRYGNPPKK